jgi:hypothetical protein
MTMRHKITRMVLTLATIAGIALAGGASVTGF